MVELPAESMAGDVVQRLGAIEGVSGVEWT
jgi:hypothetical protein